MSWLLLLLLACDAGPSGPPNVLLVTIDTLRADAVGAYGGEAATPVMDALAAEGLRYERAYSPTPLTIPAHASLHTGQRPPRHGVRDNGDFVLADGAETLAESLKAAGYDTAASVGAAVTAARWGFGQGYDEYFDEMGSDVANEWMVERSGERVIADAAGWLSRRGEAPWHLWVHFFEPHHPYAAPEPYAAAHPDAPYLGEVAWVDALLGRLLERVDLENTLVVVVADHGEGLGENGEERHGILLHGATTRVPFIIRPPDTAEGSRRGHVVARPVGLVDVAPTVLAAVGAAPLAGADGVALGLDGAEPPRRGIYQESLYVWRRYAWAPQYGLVTTEYKLLDSTAPELYAAGDLAELENLAADERTVSALTRQLTALREESEAAMMTGGTAPVSEMTRRQLEALGYIVAEGAPIDAEGLPNPRERMGMLERINAIDGLVARNELTQARAALEALLVEDPELALPKVTLARVLRKLGEPEAGLALVREAMEHMPSTLFLMEQSRLEMALGREGEALASLARTVEMDPSNEKAWEQFLSILFQRNRHQDLERLLPRAEAALPESLVVRSTRAHLLVIQKDLDAAEALMLGVVAEDPSHPLAHYGLGVIHHMRGNLPAAAAALEEELARNPGSHQAVRMLFGVYMDQDQRAKAEALVGSCLSQRPGDPVCTTLAGALSEPPVE